MESRCNRTWVARGEKRTFHWLLLFGSALTGCLFTTDACKLENIYWPIRLRIECRRLAVSRYVRLDFDYWRGVASLANSFNQRWRPAIKRKYVHSNCAWVAFSCVSTFRHQVHLIVKTRAAAKQQRVSPSFLNQPQAASGWCRAAAKFTRNHFFFNFLQQGLSVRQK